MKESTLITVSDKYRVYFDGYSYQPEFFYGGGEEVRNPKTGDLTISKPSWKRCQKWYGKLSSALFYIAQQDMLSKEKHDITEWYERFKDIEESFCGSLESC